MIKVILWLDPGEEFVKPTKRGVEHHLSVQVGLVHSFNVVTS